jgi:multidrug efflux system membrane fusion protein
LNSSLCRQRCDCLRRIRIRHENAFGPPSLRTIRVLKILSSFFDSCFVLPPMSETRSESTFLRKLLYGAVIVALGGAIWFFAGRAPATPPRNVQPAWAGTQRPPNTPVRIADVQRQSLPRHLQAIGTATPYATVTVRSRVSGQIVRIAFDEGQRVERGQLLAEIDPAPYRIRLAQAEGQLQQAEAQLATARADFERLSALHAKNLVSNQELETQRATVAQREGLRTTAQAQVDDARLQLAWTRIEAPIAGRAGLRKVDVGNLVVANDTNGLVMITQTQPIAVTFTVPEPDLPSVLDPLHEGKALQVEAWDRNETHVLATGIVRTADNQIDTATGTLRLKAEFPNADERLFPNQFVNVRLQLGSIPDAIVIPAAAVQFGSRGTYVYVVDASSKARVRDVTLGASDGSQQAITKGLSPGERVVLEGLDRLRDGRPVIVVSTPAPVSSSAFTQAK